MKINDRVAVSVSLMAVAFVTCAEERHANPVGFDRQCARRHWLTYRSFNAELERTGQFAAMGITNRCFFAANTINSGGSPYCQYPVIWKDWKTYDWKALDAQVSDLVKASPNVRLMCMIDLNTPYWATHRFHLDSFTDVTHAASDPEWRRRTAEWMLDFIHYAESKWGDRIGAYILSGGGTSEWYEYDRGRTSRNKDAAWVKWCRARGLDFGESVPSSPSLGRAAFENLVYDPVREADKIAYWKFHNGLVADVLLEFAAAARKAIPKTKEIGAFFGYFLVNDARHTSFGHLDYVRVFASPDIDFFIAPGNYWGRSMGGGSGSQLVHGTALRYGKRFLHEIDCGPHDQKQWSQGVWHSRAEDIAGNTREAAFAMFCNANYWWFDMWGSFYVNPEIRERIAALRHAQERLVPSPSAAEVLLVTDPESMYHVNERCPLERAFGEHLRDELSQIGAPHDVYSFDDLPVLDLDRYRLVCLNSTLLITPERAKFLKERVCRNGRTVLWLYGPGITDGKSISAERVREWAGVPFRTPGVSVTARGDWTSVYAYDYRLLTAVKLAEIAERARVHRYVDECLPVFATETFLTVHARSGGEKTIRLPRKVGSVTDLLTGAKVAENTATFVVRFETPDTRLFGLVP